jgi:hypothetical protein
MLYVRRDPGDVETAKVVCDSCLERERRRKQTWAFFRGVLGLIEYGGFFFWVVSIIVVGILGLLVGSFGKR